MCALYGGSLQRARALHPACAHCLDYKEPEHCILHVRIFWTTKSQCIVSRMCALYGGSLQRARALHPACAHCLDYKEPEHCILHVCIVWQARALHPPCVHCEVRLLDLAPLCTCPITTLPYCDSAQLCIDHIMHHYASALLCPYPIVHHCDSAQLCPCPIVHLPYCDSALL